jgi:hypothetical protein
MAHCYCDGISWLGTLNALSENGFRKKIEISRSQSLMQYLMMPYYTLKNTINVALQPKTEGTNLMHQPPPAKKNITYKLSDEIDLNGFRASCKKHGTKVNLACQTLVGMAIREYFKRRGDDTKEFNVL